MSDSARQFRFAAALVAFAIPVVACNGAIGDHRRRPVPAARARGRRSRRAGRQVARRGAGVVRGAEPRPLAAAAPQQHGVPQHDHRPVRERAGGGRAGSRGDERLSFGARVARLSQQRRLPHRAVARRAEVPRRRRADRRDGRRRQQLRDLRERHAGRRLRDQLHQFVRQAGLPPAARRRRHGPVRGPLPEGDRQRLRLQDGHRVDRLRDVAVAAVPLPLRARFDAHGQLRQAHALRDRRPASRTSTCRACRTPTLFAAADKGELATPAQIEAQARRLLADPKGGRLLDYFEQWLDIDTLPEIVRDGTVYPNLDPTLPALLQGETRAFVADLLGVADGHLRRALHRAVHVRQRGARPALRPHRAQPGRRTSRSTPRGARAC